MRSALAVFLIVLLVLSVVLPLLYCYHFQQKSVSDGFYFGVTYGSDTVWEAKLLIDKVKDYSNLFIVDSWDISTNETALTAICDYAVSSGLSVMVYFDYVFFDVAPWLWLRGWLENAKHLWGDRFLGVYLYDEPGGNQIDTNQWRSGPSAREAMEGSENYSDAAHRFASDIPSTISWQNVASADLPVFTSDYALYWFDYLAGYNAIFVE